MIRLWQDCDVVSTCLTTVDSFSDLLVFVESYRFDEKDVIGYCIVIGEFWNGVFLSCEENNHYFSCVDDVYFYVLGRCHNE